MKQLLENILIRAIRLYLLSFIFITSVSCNQVKHDYEDIDLRNIDKISFLLEEFFILNDYFPKDIEELKNILTNHEVPIELLNDPFFNDSELRYIPIFENDKELFPLEYIITTSNVNVDKIFKKELPIILGEYLKICEIKNITINKPVILYHSNDVMVLRHTQNMSLEKGTSSFWNDRINFNVEFEIKDNLNYSLYDNDRKFNFISKDSIIISGIYLNSSVKSLIVNKIENIKLSGFKYKTNKDTLFLKNVMISSNKTRAFDEYEDEIGELKKVYHLKGCSKN